MAARIYHESSILKGIILDVLTVANKDLDTEWLWGEDLTENGDVVWFSDELDRVLENRGYTPVDLEQGFNRYTYKYQDRDGSGVYAVVTAEEILPAQKTYDFVPYEPGGLAGMKSIAKLTAAEVRQFQNWWASLPFMEQRRYMHRINYSKQVEGYEDHGHNRVVDGKIVRIPDIKVKVIYNVLD